MGKNFLFRTDASPAMGTGHVMRCLALAQALQEGGHTATFLSSMLTQTVKERLIKEGCATLDLSTPAYGNEDAIETAQCAKTLGAEWIIVDGYSFDVDYLATLKQEGMKILAIDDRANSGNNRDIILNQNTFAKEEMYKGAKATLLLGTRYTLLRKEFWPWQAWKRDTPHQVKKIVVTLGGYDPHNTTVTVIDALKMIKEPIDVTIVFRKDDSNLASVQAKIKGTSFKIETDVIDMPTLLSKADLAIGAGGTTCYELAFMQLPMMTIVLAENQRMLAQAVEDAGLSINLGDHAALKTEDLAPKIVALMEDKDQRSRMATKGREYVDGQGASRVCMQLTESPLRLRSAQETDAKLLFEWANDPVVRVSSLSPDPIVWEDHERWFAQKLRDPQCMILIALDANETPIGQVRFDIENDEVEVDVHLAEDARGKKYAAPLLEGAIQKFFATSHVDCVSAYIRKDNDASIRSFEKAGFVPKGSAKKKGIELLHYVRAR